jgi:hypothetical protein
MSSVATWSAAASKSTYLKFARAGITGSSVATGPALTRIVKEDVEVWLLCSLLEAMPRSV